MNLKPPALVMVDDQGPRQVWQCPYCEELDIRFTYAEYGWSYYRASYDEAGEIDSLESTGEDPVQSVLKCTECEHELAFPGQ